MLEFYKADYEKWKQRTQQLLTNQHSGEGLSEEEVKNIVDEEFAAADIKHQKIMSQPGVVPMSDKFLGQEDQDGNQLWRVVCMRDQAVDYIKVMKKNGYMG